MNVLITGSSSGIGEKTKELFIEKGYRVYEIDKSINIDVCDRVNLENYIKKIGRLDIVINCAAIQDECPFENVDFDLWDKVINVNLTGYFNIIKIASKYMNRGLIINVGSVHSNVPRLNKYSYDASKAGIEMLTKESALALASKNIRVNCLSIGACRTPMNDNFTDKQSEEVAKKKTALGIILEPIDVAKVILELCQDTFKYMTGSIVVYDAGRSLKN